MITNMHYDNTNGAVRQESSDDSFKTAPVSTDFLVDAVIREAKVITPIIALCKRGQYYILRVVVGE
jgi:hypothetical protein